jgi:Tol biopolymer transport system component
MKKESTLRTILDLMVTGKGKFFAASLNVIFAFALLVVGGNSVAAQNRIAVGPPQNVAFHSQRDGNYEIYVMNPDGTGQTRITNDSATDQYPDISPNGQHIAFISNRTTVDNPTGDAEVFVMNADGSDVTQLTFDTAVEAWPRWSPNGHTIAFHSNVDGNYEIYTIDIDGSNLTRVTNYSGIDQWPDWSPDGKQLVIRRDNDIYVINTDGSDPVRLTSSGPLNQMAVFSPNGKQFAFMSTREGYCSVFTMDADGENQTNLTPKTPGDADADWCSRGPAWSTNGRQIYFTSKRPSTGTNFELYVMNSDGSDVTRLTFAAGEDGMPSVR